MLSGSNGDNLALGKVNGTTGSFNVKGSGSIIVVEDGAVNSGFFSGSGHVQKLALQNHHVVECNGTGNAFNVVEGGKISVIRGSINSGAFSGNSTG